MFWNRCWDSSYNNFWKSNLTHICLFLHVIDISLSAEKCFPCLPLVCEWERAACKPWCVFVFISNLCSLISPRKIWHKHPWQVSQETACLWWTPFHLSYSLNRNALLWVMGPYQCLWICQTKEAHVFKKMFLWFPHHLTIIQISRMSSACFESRDRQLPHSVTALKLPSHTRFGTWNNIPRVAAW